MRSNTNVITDATAQIAYEGLQKAIDILLKTPTGHYCEIMYDTCQRLNKIRSAGAMIAIEQGYNPFSK
jgi:hypothetical protein